VWCVDEIVAGGQVGVQWMSIKLIAAVVEGWGQAVKQGGKNVTM
jgi:hypothetical protein